MATEFVVTVQIQLHASIDEAFAFLESPESMAATHAGIVMATNDDGTGGRFVASGPGWEAVNDWKRVEYDPPCLSVLSQGVTRRRDGSPPFRLEATERNVYLKEKGGWCSLRRTTSYRLADQTVNGFRRWVLRRRQAKVDGEYLEKLRRGLAAHLA